jgi:hypothetical protein
MRSTAVTPMADGVSVEFLVKENLDQVTVNNIGLISPISSPVGPLLAR